MAKRSSIEKNNRREELAKKYFKKRAELRAIIRDQNVSIEEKFKAQFEMQKLPRDSNQCRYRTRCFVTGRPRAVYRRFGLARNKLREYTMMGLIPGIRKASW